MGGGARARSKANKIFAESFPLYNMLSQSPAVTLNYHIQDYPSIMDQGILKVTCEMDIQGI